ncbi:MAG: sulfate adenylyltransferase [Candidatus Azotimanducaceae bacterium]|jgi:sulfate adenylyltransferase
MIHQAESILNLPRLTVRNRQLYDLEQIMVEGFLPLRGFMNEEDYMRVVQDMRLVSGELFPIPVVLDVQSSTTFAVGDRVVLCDEYGNPLAVMNIESRFMPDKEREAKCVYGTTSLAHPGVRYLMTKMHDTYIGGQVEVLSLPAAYDFKEHRFTPKELKERFKSKGWDNVVAFQTRNPMHKAHFELVKNAHKETGYPVLIHPVVGMTKEGDIDYITRVRTYKVVNDMYGKDFTDLALLPLAMRMAGPREILWHMIIRKNYGCTHMICGRDHAGPGRDENGIDFYGKYEARDIALTHAKEIGIDIVQSYELAYSKKRDAYVSTHKLETGEETEEISGTEFRRRLFAGEEIPDWFTFQENIDVLQKGAAKQKRSGVTLFLTGLSGAGKSTIANILYAKLLELQDRGVTLLDGDIIRNHLTSELGFSKEDRHLNVSRVGYVASEITKHGGIAICSMIAPYQHSRDTAREMVEQHGTFIEIHVATPLEVCEMRDSKGLYKKARAGEIKMFTGVSDPYEIPANPELVLNGGTVAPDALANQVIVRIQSLRLLD